MKSPNVDDIKLLFSVMFVNEILLLYIILIEI